MRTEMRRTAGLAEGARAVEAKAEGPVVVVAKEGAAMAAAAMVAALVVVVMAAEETVAALVEGTAVMDYFRAGVF